MATAYTQHFQPKRPNVGNPNVTGKYALSDIERLKRFLILGTEGGTYYASEKKLTIDNAEAVKRLVSDDVTGLQAVSLIVQVSDEGRAPKNDPALLALAVAVKYGTPTVRQDALSALPKVARIGTHLFHFLDYCKALQVGWGRGFRRAISNWYNQKPADKLARQLVKYQSRDGWSNRDALRLSHAKPSTPEHQALFHWATTGEGEGNQWKVGSAVEHVYAYEQLKREATNVRDAVRLIDRYKLPREAVPTEFLNSPEVWKSLLSDMKPEAIMRNLGKMTSINVLKPLSTEEALVVGRLTDTETLKAARLHPLKLLTALLTYKSGHGLKGSLSWNPNPRIVQALEQGFYASFGYLEPTGKRILKALDVSGSMTGGECAGAPGITPRIGTAVLAMVTARIEPRHHIMGFTHGFIPLNINASMSLDSIVRYMDSLPYGATDCSLPMEWALNNGIEVDCFEVYTDNDTNSHRISPANALRKYRERTGIDAKLVVVGMTASGFSIADPNDRNMLDVVGFDTATPDVVSQFIRD